MNRILVGDVTERLRELPNESVQCVVTSPPYWGHRRYGDAREIGQESTPTEYIARLSAVFTEVRRVLVSSGVLWVNIGDSYYQGNKGQSGELRAGYKQSTNRGSHSTRRGDGLGMNRKTLIEGLKPKDLIGIPALLAFALRGDGWWWRGDNVWGKPNGMPESVEDRPGRAHEYVHLFTKSARYWYDAEAVRTAPKASTATRLKQDIENQAGSSRANGGAKTNGPMKVVRRTGKQRGHSRRHDGFNDRWDAMEKTEQMEDGANLRSVWWIAPAQTKEEHYAVMPEMVAEICIRAGCPENGTVLDPFSGFGTVGLVAMRYRRNFIGIELNPEYAAMAERRIVNDAPMFNEVRIDSL